MRQMFKCFQLSLLLTILSSLSACYYSHPRQPDRWVPNREGIVDSLGFVQTHHYWTGFNFTLTDTLSLAPNLPGERGHLFRFGLDSLVEGNQIVVADVRYVPVDNTDSVWVKVARDQLTQGWVQERKLLSRVVPTDPISKFIYYFSDGRRVVFMSCFIPAILLFLVQRLRRKYIRIVHLNDIPSFYPTLLCLCVSTGAMLYGTMQRFAPETWVEFYFSPTLNPFNPTLPLILALFIASVWAMLITGCAVIDEMRRQPDLGDTLSYIASLIGVCILLYLVFTLTVPYYFGYLLYAAYCAFAIRQYVIHRPSHLLCGNCGRAIPMLGTCPHCGVENK